eukprot:1399612-Rhodomonas_salina.3
MMVTEPETSTSGRYGVGCSVKSSFTCDARDAAVRAHGQRRKEFGGVRSEGSRRELVERNSTL